MTDSNGKASRFGTTSTRPAAPAVAGTAIGVEPADALAEATVSQKEAGRRLDGSAPATVAVVRALVSVGSGLLVGLAVGSVAWGIVGALLVALAWGMADRRRFLRWARAPLAPPRLAWSLWQPAAGRLFTSLRRSRRRMSRLVAELRWLHGTLNSIPDGWIVLRRDGAIEAINQGASQMLGLALRDRRRNLSDLLRDPSIASLVRGDAEDGIVEIPSPVEDARRLELRHLVVDENRSIILIRDVTMLDRLLTMRQDFIANVSHELRTPLTVIIGYLEALEDDDIDEETLRRLLGRLRVPADRMKALVEDLLTLTRLESSPRPGPGDMEAVNGTAMLQSVINEARQLATPQHDIVLDADPAVTANAVPGELHSAFFNLIANAIRYSPDGGVVHVRWRQGDGGPRLEVEDHGLGIPPEHISRLTERFFRVDLPKSRVRGGTGLGLAIVKHILRRHGTRLHVASELGKGSLFSFELPAADAATPTSGPLLPAAPDQAASPVN